jgi:hypothetical protein
VNVGPMSIQRAFLAPRWFIVARYALAIAVCVIPTGCMEHLCDGEQMDGRTLSICVDVDILEPQVSISGECTDLVMSMGTSGSQCWDGTMTGEIGSTCVIRVMTGAKVYEKVAKLEPGLCQPAEVSPVNFEK